MKDNDTGIITESFRDNMTISTKDFARKSMTSLKTDQMSLLSRGITRQTGLRKSSRINQVSNPALKARKDMEKKLQSRVDFLSLKLKNTKRALNITKTLFGMVDEMDSTDFCA